MNGEKSSKKFTKEAYREYLFGQVKRIDDTQYIYGLSQSDKVKLMVLEFKVVKEIYNLDNEKE